MAGYKFSVWDSYGLSKYELRAGSFSEDSRGRWYFNVAVEVDVAESAAKRSVGIDLGLKDFATTSDGHKEAANRFYRSAESALAVTQRSRSKKRVRSIHAKIRNQRKDSAHKFSTALVREYGAIFVGDVNSKRLAKTKMAKSVLDAGWSMFRTMLQYKSHQAGVLFEVVGERNTTRTCSCCGSLSGPRGVNGLRIREWTCVGCGAVHDRDTNAAQNILQRGRALLEVGIPAL